MALYQINNTVYHMSIKTDWQFSLAYLNKQRKQSNYYLIDAVW